MCMYTPESKVKLAAHVFAWSAAIMPTSSSRCDERHLRPSTVFCQKTVTRPTPDFHNSLSMWFEALQ